MLADCLEVYRMISYTACNQIWEYMTAEGQNAVEFSEPPSHPKCTFLHQHLQSSSCPTQHNPYILWLHSMAFMKTLRFQIHPYLTSLEKWDWVTEAWIWHQMDWNIFTIQYGSRCNRIFPLGFLANWESQVNTSISSISAWLVNS